MKIQDIKKIKWKRGNVWQEKWYNTELCFVSLAKSANPIYNLFTKVGCSSIALNIQWFHEEKNYNKQEQDLQKALENKIDFISKVVSLSENYIKETESILKKVRKTHQIDVSLFEDIEHCFLLVWHIFNIDLGEYLPKVIEQKLADKKLSAQEMEEIEEYYFINHKPLAFQKEEESLKKISSFYKQKYKNKVISLGELPSDIRKLLLDHWEKFHWLMSDEIDTDYYTIEDYFERMRQFLSLKKSDPKHKKDLSAETKNRLDYETLNFLELVNRHLFIDNYAADLYTKLEFYFLERLSKKTDVSFRELSWYTVEELKQLIGNGIKLTKAQLDERKSHRVIVQIDGKITFFYGKNNFDRISSVVKPKARSGGTFEIKGIVASKGQAQGRVKIIRSIKDIGKMNEGDILVATTTRPDLMPAILKCAAIVTDVGGITSHAAIVSRELKIPCVVATKIATHVLNDGDSVWVNADKGEVTLLK